jgi:TonB family protein
MEAVMPSMPQQIRNGFIELRTHTGPAYVSPSFWERIYLLWTFRNFHSLPRQVLNRRQQQLIDKLCRAAIVNQNRLIARASIIGTVENVQLLPDYKTQPAASTSKVVEIAFTGMEVAGPRAVGSEDISIRSNRRAYNRIGVRRFPAQGGNVQCIPAPSQDSAEQREAKGTGPALSDSGARRTRTQNRATWALSALFVAALVGAFVYFREARLAPPKRVVQGGIEAQIPAPTTIFLVAAQQPEKVKQPMPAVHSQPSTIIASFKPPSPAIPSRQHESSNRKAVIVSQPPVENMDSTLRERLHVAEAPESGFCYPVAPNPTLTGKVSLKAIIDTNGTVKEVDVLSGNRALADAAVRVVRQWRYHPPETEGHAVEAETHIVISFVGSDAVSISFPAAQ